MSYIEFQINLSSFLEAQRNVLLSFKPVLCSPNPIPIGPIQIILDRIEFGNNSIQRDAEQLYTIFYDVDFEGNLVAASQSADGYPLLLVQEVTVFVSSLNDILSRPNQPPNISIPIHVTLFFSIDFYTLGDDCYLSVHFRKLTLGQLPILPQNFDPRNIPSPITISQIIQIVSQRLSSAFPSQAIPIGLGRIKVEGVKFLNAGVSMNAQLNSMSFRVQIGGQYPEYSGLVVNWTNYLHGLYEDRLQGRDWSISIDTAYINSFIQTKIVQLLAQVKNGSLQSYPGCNYSNSGGKANFKIDILFIYDLPDPLGKVESDPNINLEVSVNPNNWINIDIDYTDVLDFSDFYLQFLKKILDLFGFPVESFLYSIIGTYAIEKLADTPLTNCKQVSETHIQCSNYIKIPLVPGTVQTTLTNIIALDNAIALSGTVNVHHLTPAILQTNLVEFEKIAPSIRCGSAGLEIVAFFSNDPSGFAILYARGFIKNGGTAPLYLCNLNVINDPFNAFPNKNIKIDSGTAPIDISLHMPIPPANYNGYPCDILIQTTAGTRLMRYAAPPKVTKADLDLMEAKLIEALGNCEQLVNSWFHDYGKYDLHWGPRPPEGIAVEHFWQFNINGLKPGESASIVNAEGLELVRGIGDSNTNLQLSILISPQNDRGLSILHLGRSNQQVNELRFEENESIQNRSKESISVEQTMLINRGNIPLPNRCLKIKPLNYRGKFCILTILEEEIIIYNVDNLVKPFPIMYRNINGINNLFNWQEMLLYSGKNGFGWINNQGQLNSIPKGCESIPILDAAIEYQKLYAVTNDGLEVYSGSLCKIDMEKIKGCKSILKLDDNILIGGEFGLRMYKGSNIHELIAEYNITGKSISNILRPLGLKYNEFLVLLKDRTAKSFQIIDDKFEETVNFSKTPWFADSIRIGRYLLKIGTGRRSIDILQFGKTHMDK